MGWKNRRLALGPALLAFLWAMVSGRALAATVTWIGPAAGDWTQPGSWSSGTLPGPGDDVIVGAGSLVTLTHSGGISQVRSLTLTGTLRLTGGALSLSAGASSADSLFLDTGAGLTVTGPFTTFIVTRSAEILGGEMIALDGARITLPQATTYAGFGLLRAQGSGSRLVLDQIGSIGIPQPEPFLATDAISRSVGVLNGLVDDSIGTVYREAVSRSVGVYNDLLANAPTDPLDALDSAVSRSVGVYNDALANQPTDPLALMSDAVSR